MIRAYQPQDARQIQQITLKCFDYNIRGTKKLYLARYFVKSYFKEKNIASRLKNQYEIYIYVQDNEIIGFIEIQNADTVTNIFIDPNHQRHKAGSQLLDYAIARCQEINPQVEKITLDASLQAVGFYQHYGFVRLPRMKKVMGVEMYVMEKKLKNN